MYPKIIIDLQKLRHNALFLYDLLKAKDISLALVTKVFCAYEPIVDALAGLPFDYYADSRLSNLARISTDKPKMLLRLPALSNAMETVRRCDISLNSEFAVLSALDSASRVARKKHKVVLMIDLGDLREGIFCEDRASIDLTCSKVLNSRLELYGIATNLTCYGSVIPTVETLNILIAEAERIEKKFKISLSLIGGGNSSTLPLVLNNTIPKRINNLRIGEAFVLGVETAYGEPIAGMYQDAFTIQAEVIEVFRKPSHPIGLLGMNAFGEKCQYEDKGFHRRAICAIGRQDTLAEGLTPLVDGVTVVGSSSDHLIIECPQSVTVGDIISFRPSYGALLRAFTSDYIDKVTI